MYLRRIVWAVALMGLLAMGIFSYYVYNALFAPNTKMEQQEVFVFIATDSDFEEVSQQLEPFLEDMGTFRAVARRKKYSTNIRPGRYAIKKGMNNNEIVNSLRSRNLPVQVSFNNQESLPSLAGRIASQLEADSITLTEVFEDSTYLNRYNLDSRTGIALYVPNTYEFFWNTDAMGFRDRMLREYEKFWNEERLNKAESLGLTPLEVITLASVVHKETAKVEERPRVAGVYLNRLEQNMPLQADPTVIYAVKHKTGNFDTIIKRVLYRDLELDSPYNTYKYGGLPPGPITMPDISAIDAVLNAEDHDYYYFVVDVERWGYHKFAESLAQHNRNKVQYIRWINAQRINR
jgi:UPF0755 protein